MNVSDLKPNDKVGTIELKVVEKEEPRNFTTKWGRSGRVCKVIGEDDTGRVKVTLWNDDIDMVEVNHKIRITNGYVKEWQGDLEVSAGKYGKLEVVE